MGRAVCARLRNAFTTWPASSRGLRARLQITHAKFLRHHSRRSRSEERGRYLEPAQRRRYAICAHLGRTPLVFRSTKLRPHEKSSSDVDLSRHAVRAFRKPTMAVAPKSATSSVALRTSLLILIFNTHDTETEMLRYLRKLESRDLSLAHSMIPLGSCTMKLNATAEMFPISWPEFSKLHPFAPLDQTRGYAEMCNQLENWLAEITGFAAVSLQPNAGSQGEYAGLLAIREYHRLARRRRAQRLPDSTIGPWNESGERGDGRVLKLCRWRR